MTFSTIFMLIRCVGGVQKGQKYADVKFGYSEKATKFNKIFHLKFDATQ